MPEKYFLKWLLDSPPVVQELLRMVTEFFSNTLLVGASFAIAFLIGATSIGGMLLGPSLNMLGEVPIHMAIPSCMFAFIFAGGIGAIFF